MGSNLKSSRVFKCMWWNSRGLANKFLDVTAYMELHGISVCGVSESRLYGDKLSSERWCYLNGPEHVPDANSPFPRLGLGVIVDSSVHPTASAVYSGEYCFWVRLPGLRTDVYFCSVYSPDNLDRAALSEILKSSKLFADKGFILFGGDFNARCSLNGDAITNGPGRRLLDWCALNSFSVLNSSSCVSGHFSRTQDMVVDGIAVTRKSTLDYIITPSAQDYRLVNMCLAEDHDLLSDHKPVVACFSWVHASNAAAKPSFPKHRKWCLESLHPAKIDRYEGICNRHMVQYWQSFGADPDTAAQTFYAAINTAGREGIGSKMVGGNSKPGFDKAIVSLVRERTLLRSRIAKTRNPALASARRDKLAVLRDKIRAIIRFKRNSALHTICRSIERSTKPTERVNWKRWKSRSNSSCHRIPDVAVNLDGELVTEPECVLIPGSSLVSTLAVMMSQTLLTALRIVVPARNSSMMMLLRDVLRRLSMLSRSVTQLLSLN